MKLRIGIIAEYNPFHNGHIYQINWIKREYPNSTIIAIMSGDYVQRGEIAISSFEERKRVAIEHGIDEVHELPFEFATQAAHIFAFGALQKANELKIDLICFGSETNNIDLFYKIANTIKKNESAYYEILRKKLKTGISFPKASEMTLQELTNTSFKMPNDILGLEYIKAIVFNDLPIKAISIKRTVGFHSYEVKGNIASATHIRNLIHSNNEEYKKYTPMRFNEKPRVINDLYPKFQKIIRETPSEEIAKIKLVSEGIENLFKKNIEEKTYDEFVNKVNSKRYTSSRIKRTMLYILLNIKG